MQWFTVYSRQGRVAAEFVTSPLTHNSHPEEGLSRNSLSRLRNHFPYEQAGLKGKSSILIGWLRPL